MGQVVRNLYSLVDFTHTQHTHFDLVSSVLKIVLVQLVDDEKEPLVVRDTCQCLVLVGVILMNL